MPDFSLRFIPYNQGVDLISKLHPVKHKELMNVNRRFGGLCELVCNRILFDDLLGKGTQIDYIRKHVNVERMNEDKVKKSHILDIYSIFRRALAYLFGIYPGNIFSCFDQWSLVSTAEKVAKVNREILGQGLQRIAEGETLKLSVFSRSFCDMQGHSLLIKKMVGDKYIFFDPNSGEHRNFTFTQLGNEIDRQLFLHRGNDIYLTRGSDFLELLA